MELNFNLPRADFFIEGGIVNELRITAAIIGTAITEWLGGIDGLLTALIAFIVVDYLTGVSCAIVEKNLSSAVGAKGILQKVIILMLVGVANLLDNSIIADDGHLLRTAVIFFYLSNEGISILENSVRLGLPVPDKLKNFLEQIKSKS